MLGKWIISHFPEHKTYVEPFGGAASVLLQKPRVYAEIYNDRWDLVVTIFRVLRDPESNARLKELLIKTPFSRTEFEQTDSESLAGITDPLEISRRVIFRSFAGFGSAASNPNFTTGFRNNATRSGTIPATDWMNYPKNLDLFLDRLRGVVIENRSAISIIEKYDSPQTLFYVDPPYVHSTRNTLRGRSFYQFEMNDQEHIELAVALSQVKGMVILSGYDCPLYQLLYSGWHQIQKKSMADGARPRLEKLYFNAAAAKMQNRA